MSEGVLESSAEPLREHLRQASVDPAMADKVLSTFSAAMETTKRARVSEPCAKCGCQHIRWVEVPDAVAASQAAKVFMEHVEGRLGSAAGDSASVVVRRTDVREVVSATEVVA